MARSAAQREQVYAVLRYDGWLESTSPPEGQVTVKEIVRDLEIAQAEVERLNRLNGHKNCRYYWQTTRLFGPGESFGTHRPAEGQP